MNTQIKILVHVLDDEQIWLDMISDMFKDDAEYQIECFTNPDDFYAAFSKKCDLVITDVRVKTGYDVLSTIKTISTINPTCYIIVMSAFFDVPLMRDLLRLRVNDTILKTHDISWLTDLKDAIDRMYPKLKTRAEISPIIFKA